MLRTVVSMIILLLAVSACVTTPAQTNALAPLRAAKTAEVKPAEPAPTTEEGATEKAATAEAAAATDLAEDEMQALPEDESLVLSAVITPPPAPTPEPAPQAPPPPPELDPASLVGTARAGLASTLGEPVLRRREGIAEVWQYRMPNCIIDFVLADGETVTALQHRHRRRGEVVDPVTCRQEMARLAGL
ncbi:MAG: hypothetical protein ACON4P_03575 [Candidatus Puniceispirillales bacterium]